MVDKLNKIEQLEMEKLLELCKECQGIDECTQHMRGLIPTVVFDPLANTFQLGKKKCDKVRGLYNDTMIKEDRYKQWNPDNKKEILDIIRETKNLYLWSSVGKGKTHGLYYLANLFNLKGQDVSIDLMSNIVRKAKNYDNSFNRAEYIDMLQTVDNLFIDDLGNEYATEYTIVEILFPIIDERYKRGRKTFISSNYTLESLATMYAGIIASNKKLTTDQAYTKVLTIKSRFRTFGEIELKGRNWRI